MSFENAQFINTEPRCACVILADTSGSMKGERIKALNEGLQRFSTELTKDVQAKLRIEVAIIEFNSEVKIVQDFIEAEQFIPPQLNARGLTYMGTGVMQALSLVESRKRVYKDVDIAYYRPVILMITDGQPEGEAAHLVDQAAREVRKAHDERKALFLGVGVEGANMQQLARICVRPPKKLKGLEFVKLFDWLSSTLIQISHSTPGAGSQVTPPSTDEWAEPFSVGHE
jgi:uncharacterized protein YegL